MAKVNSEFNIPWGKLRSSRNAIFVRSLVAHQGVTLLEVANAAMGLGLAEFTIGALVRAVGDGDDSADAIRPVYVAPAIWWSSPRRLVRRYRTGETGPRPAHGVRRSPLPIGRWQWLCGSEHPNVSIYYFPVEVSAC